MLASAVTLARPRKPPTVWVTSEAQPSSSHQAQFDNDDSSSISSESQVDTSSNNDITGNDIEQLTCEVSKLKEVTLLKKEIILCLDNIAALGDHKISFYTGLPSFGSLKACFDVLGPSVHHLTYWSKPLASDVKGKGRPRTLVLLEEFFMVLIRLRLGSFEQDLADCFGVSSLSCSTVSRVFATWINILYLKLKEIPTLAPSRGHFKQHAKII